MCKNHLPLQMPQNVWQISSCTIFCRIHCFWAGLCSTPEIADLVAKLHVCGTCHTVRVSLTRSVQPSLILCPAGGACCVLLRTGHRGARCNCVVVKRVSPPLVVGVSGVLLAVCYYLRAVPVRAIELCLLPATRHCPRSVCCLGPNTPAGGRRL